MWPSAFCTNGWRIWEWPFQKTPYATGLRKARNTLTSWFVYWSLSPWKRTRLWTAMRPGARCANMTTTKSVTSGYWSTRLRKRLFSSMRMAPGVVRYLQTSWVTRNWRVSCPTDTTLMYLSAMSWNRLSLRILSIRFVCLIWTISSLKPVIKEANR